MLASSIITGLISCNLVCSNGQCSIYYILTKITDGFIFSLHYYDCETGELVIVKLSLNLVDDILGLVGIIHVMFQYYYPHLWVPVILWGSRTCSASNFMQKTALEDSGVMGEHVHL